MKPVRDPGRIYILTDIEVREYGYSNALWKLCPQGWKDSVGE